MQTAEKEHKDVITIKEIYYKVKKVFKITKPSIPFLILSSICATIASFCQALGLGLIIPALNGLIDKGHFVGIMTIPVLGSIVRSMPFAHTDINIFLFIMFLIMAVVCIEDIILFISRVSVALVSSRANYTMSTKIFGMYLTFARAFYDKSKLAELNMILAMSSSCTNLIMWLNNLLIKVCFVLTYFVFMTVISWKLTLSVFVILFTVKQVTKWVSMKIMLSVQKGTEEGIKLSVHTWDIMSNISLIKLYATEKKEYKKFTEISKELQRHGFNATKKREFLPLSIDIISSMGMIAIVCISVFLFFWRSDYSMGKFLVYFVVLRRFIDNVNQLSGSYSNFASSLPTIKKVFSIFDDSDKVYIKNGSIMFNVLEKAITFKNVHFSYMENIPILKNVSFTVEKGKTVAIVGPTGAGKTSIVNLLPRFYEYNSGSIEMDEKNIREFDLKSLRKKISVVSQDILLMNDTIKNNIIYGLEENKVDMEMFDEVMCSARIYDFVMGLPDKYDTFVGDRGIRLSGGEKQRVSIARALLKNPDILILDEATSSLDAETEMLVQQAIEKAIKGRTVFVIAHRLSTIKNADWIIVLEGGEIKEQGKLKDLLDKKGRFYHYWTLQKLFY